MGKRLWPIGKAVRLFYFIVFCYKKTKNDVINCDLIAQLAPAFFAYLTCFLLSEFDRKIITSKTTV